MTIDNAPGEGVNDAALTNDDGAAPFEKQGTNTEMPYTQKGNDTEGEETEGEAAETPPDEVEVDYEGEKFKLPTKLKDALLRQADYTRKTQEIAEAKRQFEQEREGFAKQTEAQKAHFAAATKLAAVDDRLAEYAKVDWQTLYNTNPDLYQQHRITYDTLKDQRDAVARDFSQKEQERRQNEERESANRIQKAQADIKQHLPEWTPGGELDLKLSQYGISQGLTQQVMSEMALREPRFVALLNRLRLADEAAAKQKTQQSFQQSQAAKPVTRVGGNSGSAARKTTDASGDALSTEEWIRRENERVASQRKAMGRR